MDDMKVNLVNISEDGDDEPPCLHCILRGVVEEYVRKFYGDKPEISTGKILGPVMEVVADVLHRNWVADQEHVKSVGGPSTGRFEKDLEATLKIFGQMTKEIRTDTYKPEMTQVLREAYAEMERENIGKNIH